MARVVAGDVVLLSALALITDWLMRAGLIPEETCEACTNVSLRYGQNV